MQNCGGARDEFRFRIAQGALPCLFQPGVCACFILLFVTPVLALRPGAEQIVRASVSSTKADWEAVSRFSYLERDDDEKGGVKSSQTYRVCMIEGSTYSHLIAVDGEPLSTKEQARENEKLRAEITRRANESSPARAKRIAEYQRGRQRLFALLDEMTDAFEFKDAGQQKIDGKEVLVLQAIPRPGYQPKSRETKLLTAMKGTLWIDKTTYQWVRVEAEAIKPVWMGWFIAKVLPGTRFSLEQVPVMGKLWLPGHFVVQVRTKILWWDKNYTHSETYSDYRLQTRSANSP